MEDSNREFVFVNGQVVGYLCKECQRNGILAIMPTPKGYRIHCTRVHGLFKQLEIIPEGEFVLTP